MKSKSKVIEVKSWVNEVGWFLFKIKLICEISSKYKDGRIRE